MVSGKGLANLFNGRWHGPCCPLPLPSGFAEFCNGLGFAGRPGLVNGYLGVDLLDHTAAGEGDKASRRCLGQFGEIVPSGLRTAFVDHVVPEALGLGRWGKSPCSAESHGDHRCLGVTADQALQARWRVAGHGSLWRRFRVGLAPWSSGCSMAFSTSKTSHTFGRPTGKPRVRLGR